ncbi:MAG: transposase [Acidobacteria bacterium]|nr:transposase [Acidobacteriota bacterium]
MDKSLLDLYTDYLICSFGQVSATGLARLLDHKLSHDTVTRFLSAAPKTSADLWRVVKPLVRAVESESGVLVIDDSIEEKPSTDENELVSWHYDHSQERTVKGINFLTALYHSSDVSLPVAFDLVTKTQDYFDPKTRKTKRKSAMTKNERFRMLLRIAVHNEVKFGYVLNDVWFASSENMKFIKHSLRKEFVMPVKENRKVALSLANKQRGHYTAVNSLTLTADQTLEVWLEEVDFPLSVVREVFINEDGSRGVRHLVTSDLALSFDQLTKLYQKRWSIEVYHKSLKQNASLEKSPTRTPTTQRNHFFAALCAYIKLEGLKVKTKVSHFTLKSKLYLSAVKAAYAEFVKLNPQPLIA